MPYWTLVITQANKERLATQNISNQGYEYYLPVFRERIFKQDKPFDVTKVLFPRYIFVKVRQQWASLTGTYGVSGVLMDGVSPKVIPERVIEKIKQRQDAEGFVVL
jgi:transcriptional antiterminator RfaH